MQESAPQLRNSVSHQAPSVPEVRGAIDAVDPPAKRSTQAEHLLARNRLKTERAQNGLGLQEPRSAVQTRGRHQDSAVPKHGERRNEGHGVRNPALVDSQKDRCSSAERRPSPYGRKVGSSEKLSGPSQGSLTLRPAPLPSGLSPDIPEASADRSPDSTAPAATGVYRQLPGRDSHPPAFETQRSPISVFRSDHQIPPSCRTASRLFQGGAGSGSLTRSRGEPGSLETAENSRFQALCTFRDHLGVTNLAVGGGLRAPSRHCPPHRRHHHRHCHCHHRHCHCHHRRRWGCGGRKPNCPRPRVVDGIDGVIHRPAGTRLRRPSRAARRTGHGTVVLQRLVSARIMVVGDVAAENSAVMLLIEDHKTWSRHSRRMEPISRSQNGFCQGEWGAVLTSSIPIDSMHLANSPEELRVVATE